jgi:hypothetical protein
MNSSTQADRGIRRDALRALLVFALLIGAPAAAYGLLLVGIDLARQGEDWDGLGIILGSMVAVPALAVSGLALVALRGARRRTDGGRGSAFVIGLLLVAPALLAPGTPLLLLPMVVGIGMVGVSVLGGPTKGRS